MQDFGATMAELEAPDDRRERELALAREGLRVDREPRLALGPKHVVSVEVLMEEDLLALRRRELLERLDRSVQQRALERASRVLPALR